MKKLYIMASVLVLAPALAANAAYKTTHHKKTHHHKAHASEPRYIPEHQLPEHLKAHNLAPLYDSNTNLDHTSAQAAHDDEKANSINFGVTGDLDYRSQDTDHDFRGPGYSKPSIGVVEISSKARIANWINLHVAGSYSQFTDHDSRSDYIKLEQAYGTIGDFYKTPFYLTMGYQYLPFGVYTPYSITGSVTKQMDEAENNMVGLGYEKGNYYALAYFYGSHGYVNNESHSVTPRGENFGLEGGITHTWHEGGLHANAAYLNNYREVSLISNLDPRNLDRVGAMSVHADVYQGRFGLLGDWTFTTSSFNQAAMSYNGASASPQSFFVQGYVRFDLGTLPSAIGLGYGHSSEALALQLPQDRIVVNYSLLLSQHFSAQAQYTHANDYPTTDSSVMNRDSILTNLSGTGKDANAYQVRLSFAFGDQKPDMYSELDSAD